jgi:hypothetical protein
MVVAIQRLPIGLALVVFPPAGRLLFFSAAVFFEAGHSLSAIVMAWTHRGFRAIMFRQPKSYLLLPLVVFGSAFAIDAVTSLGWTSFIPGPYHDRQIADRSSPFPILVWIYLIWNGCHFGMQIFGVLSLYRKNPRNARQRRIDMFLCLAGTALGMYALPMLAGSQSLVMLCAFLVQPLVVTIGLTSRISRHTWVFIVMLVMGTIGCVWVIPTSSGPMIRVIPIICARMGLGFVHFLYDRWVWKLSDPLVARRLVGIC